MQQSLTEIDAVWRPIPNSSQELALDTRANVTLFFGTRGPGKTDVQLMRFRRRVGVGYGAFWRGVIFDRAYKNLDDLVAKSKRWFNAFGDGAKWLKSNAEYKWVWPTGEELLFRSIESEDDYWNYHGQEFPFIGWNELTKFPTSKLFDMMMSCNRSSWTQDKDSPKDDDGKPTLDPLPLEVFATTNPFGPGHLWCKQRFIDPAPFGQVVRKDTVVFNPAKQQDEVVTLTQVAIFGSYRENIYLDPQYIAMLSNITDPNMRKAWLTGSWDIVGGGALDDVWNSAIHVVPRFVVPASWKIDRALDWGSSHPFSVGWFAQSNGEEATLPDGRKFAPPAGSLIQLAEIYGADQLGTNAGLRKSAADVALLIKEKEKRLLENGWIARKPLGGPADNQIRDVRESDVDTIETKMATVGISWIESDKSPGSRRNGLQLIRDRLEAAIRGEGPGLYFMDCCRASITLLPILPRDEDKIDDVDTTSEDHAYDMVRYRVLHGSVSHASKLKVKFG